MTDDQTDGRAGSVSRRNVLAAGGTALALSIAGCANNEGSSGNGSGDNGSGDEGLGGGGGDGGSDLSGEAIVTGSSTVFPISDQMAQNFMEENPDVNVTVDSTGTGGGFENHFCPGNSDINGASRPIKEEESASCEENGVEPVEFRVAGDALTMAVSPDNDWVDSMTYDQMAQIWQEGGAETWADVNSDWPDEEFALFGPDDTSGTFDWFTENVVGEAGNHRSDYEPTEDDNIIIEGLENNEYSLGYFGFAYYQENQDRVKALAVAESEGDEPVEPSLEAAQSGDYPMARPLFIYPNGNSLSEKEQVYAFTEYYLDNSDESFIGEEIGYVPSNSEQVDENLSTLEEYQ